MESELERVLIIGASAAGMFTAEALRRHGFTGEIIVAGDEPPYDRPPLSKQVLKGDWTDDRATLMPPTRMATVDARTMFDKKAVGLDVTSRTVCFADGSTLHYDELVIATGAQPRRLKGVDHDGVHELRTVADAAGLREAILANGELLIIGAGFIGLEVAATAVALGARVTVVEPLAQPLANRIGATTAARLMRRHEDAGVDLRLGIGVSEIRPEAGGSAVVLADGTVLRSAAVCVGIGCAPGTAWLENSGLNLRNGVVCDEYCAAAPHVWAAGDVANWHHLGLGRHIRIEHRTNAQEQGEAVARNILGARTPFTPVPFFWSDQYDVKLQCAGILPDDPADEGIVEEGDAAGNSFLRAYYRDGILVGALGWNAAKAMPAYRRLIRFDNPSHAIVAADEHVPMRNSL